MPYTDQGWPNLPAMMLARAREWPTKPLFRFWREKAWQSLNWAEFAGQVAALAAFLRAQGITPGDRVLLVSENRPEFPIADTAIMAIGAITVPTYVTNLPSDHAHILRDSGARFAIVSTAALAAHVLEGAALAHGLDGLLCCETPPEAPGLASHRWADALSAPADPLALEAETHQIASEALACLIYTSGTTGKPKGVMLSHNNLLHQVKTLGTVVQPQPGDVILSILPSWHSYERSGEYFLLSQGCTQVYTNLRSVKQDLKKFKPHYMIAVPRLWESIHEGVLKQFREQPANKQRLINFLLGMSETYIQKQRIAQGLSLNHLHASSLEKFASKIVALVLLPFHALGERLVYAKVREAVGGRMKHVITGGGALPRHIDTFFEIISV